VKILAIKTKNLNITCDVSMSALGTPVWCNDRADLARCHDHRF